MFQGQRHTCSKDESQCSKDKDTPVRRMRVSVPRTKNVLLTVVIVQFLIITVGVYIVSQRVVDIKQLSHTTGIRTTLQPDLSEGVGCEQDFNDINNARGTTVLVDTGHVPNPLEDFRRYPCIKGIPIFAAIKRSTEGRCVHSFCYSKVKNKTTKNCVTLRTPQGTTPICTYPVEKDIHISGSIHRDSQWEGSRVKQLADLFIKQPNLEFLDLGCNIGAYTVALAHQSVKVTAVDPTLENLELLSRSLKLGNLQQNVTLIWIAVSNKRQLITFRGPGDNVGGTHIQDANANNSRGYMARTMLLDDLLPLFRGKHIVIKMDIESSEYFALLGGSQFFEEVTVVVLQIEMLITKYGDHGIKIVDYLNLKGFYPFIDIDKRYQLYQKSIKSWPNDIYFAKTTQF